MFRLSVNTLSQHWFGQGENGVQLGYGESWYHQNNVSVTIQLVERGWYRLGDGPASRPLLLSVLADVKYLQLRAKFHTDQVEGRSVQDFGNMLTSPLGDKETNVMDFLLSFLMVAGSKIGTFSDKN